MEKMTAESRSNIMRAVRSSHTKPEVAVRKALHAAGFRYRLHVRDLPGKPDIVFPKFRAVIEVRGCFWHWHTCCYGHLPDTNKDYWNAKLQRNRERDEENVKRLRALGYRVKIIWECQVKTETQLAVVSHSLSKWLLRQAR